MKDIFFWLRWKSSYQTLYVALLLLFIGVLTATACAYVYGDLYTIGWDATGEWKNIALGIDTFDVNQFTISQESQQYLLQQRYVPADVKVHPWISYAYIGVILLAFVILLTVISYLEIWLYAIGMALFFFYLVNMHTEQLGIFGMYNRVFVAGSILLFCSVTYYFNAYGKHLSLFLRLGTLTLTTIAFAACIQFGSSIEHPFLYASNYSIAVPIVLSILFMFLVGYDIIQLLVVVTSFGRSDYKTSGNSIWNFILIGGLYLTNLFIVQFKPAFLDDLNLVFLQPFVVLAISAIAGIWMFSEKKEVSGVIPFQPLGAILFLALAIITFSTIALGYATANDSLITTLEKAAVYIQIGMGLAVFFYVILNFWNKYKKQEEVYKIFYVTYQVPFFVARSVGWVIAFYFFFISNRYIYFTSLAAYYNHVGDVYLYTEQDDLAAQHYKNAYQWEFQGQRTCYTLGNFYAQRDNKEEAFTFYQACLNKKPTAYAYTALSTFYINNDQYFPALFMLQDGLKKYPEDPHLLNNIGYLHTRLSQNDSSVFYYTKAMLQTSDEMPASNLLAYYAQKADFSQCDTIIHAHPNFVSNAYLANRIGANTMSGQTSSAEHIPASIATDSLVDAYSFTYLYNYAFSRLNTSDSLLHAILDRCIRNPDNSFYKPNLMYAKAIQLYYSQTNVPAALQLVDELVQTESTPLYIITLADWQLKSGLYDQANDTYRLLMTYPDQRMVAYRCLAAYEAGKKSNVSELVTALSESQIPQAADIAHTLLLANKQPSTSNYQTYSDTQKVQCIQYHTLSDAEWNLLKQSIHDPVQSILLNIQRIHSLNTVKEYAKALELWNAMEKPESIPEEIIAQSNLEYLAILAGMKQWDALKKELSQTALLKKDIGYIDYYTALSMQHSADSAKALPYFQKAIARIGYSGQVQADYANYIAAVQGNDMQALEALVEAKKIIVYSKPLSLTYIEICLRLGLFKSAEIELNAISYALSKEETEQMKGKFFVSSLQ